MVVLGYALETQYELTVDLVETPRELRPAAALALGQVHVYARCVLQPTLELDSSAALVPPSVQDSMR